MGKLEVYNIIIDKGIPYEKLADQIKIDEFVNAFTGKEKLLDDNGIKFTYGVNVRISKKSDKDILPFSYSCPYFDSVVAAKNVTPGKNIPDFIKESQLKEICFCAIFNDNTKTCDITFIDDVLEDFSGICVSRIFNPFNNKTVPNNSIKHFFDSGNTFLHENRKCLGLQENEPVYVWICGEDPDVSMDSETTYLTNIVAITNSHDTLKKFVNEKRLDILKFVMLLKSRRTDDFYVKQREEAIKSAKAAIMSRNMSHNLGSHVMAYLKQHLGSVREMLRNNVLSSLVEEENSVLALLALAEKDITKVEELIASLKTEKQIETPPKEESSETTVVEDPLENVALPFLVGLGQFISYLQERQDFIATIATDFIPYFSTINFKDFIYDELNNDKRYERHPDRQNLKPDNILLGNIARSEGLGRETRPTSGKNKTNLGGIVLKFRSTFTGDPVEIIGGNQEKKAVNPLVYYDNDQKKVDQAYIELDEMRKYNVSLPGGVVGRQAIFSIFENTIRNAAKHGNWREKGKLELTIDIFTKEDIKIEVDKDNKKRYYRRFSQDANYVEMPNDAKNEHHLSLGEALDRFYLNSKDADDIFIVTLTDNLTFNENDLAKLRMAIAEDYIDKEGRMIEANKGIKEMRISASWLRSIKDEKQSRPIIGQDVIGNPQLEDLKYDIEWKSPGSNYIAPIFYARISKEKDGDHLQYVFCLVKPQKVALVSSDFKKVRGEYQGRHIFSQMGWKIFAPADFINSKNKNFDYVVFDEKTNKKSSSNKKSKEYIEVRRHSPSLFFSLSDLIDITEIIEIKNFIMAARGKTLMSKEDLRNKLDVAYKKIGSKIASWDGSERILISDDRSKSNFEKDIAIKNDEKTELTNMISFELNDNVKYRYITHLETKQNFLDSYVNDEHSYKFPFSEGITGNNSTDRLLRNDTLDKEWFYRHLYVMKQKIAIFDERLFSKAFGLEETDFVIPQIDQYGKIIEDDKKCLKKIFPGNDEDIDDLPNYTEMNNYLAETFNYSPKIGKDKEEVDSKYYLGATYAAKGLYVFSLIRSCVNKNCFNLYGFLFDRTNNEAFSKCKKFAEFSWDSEQKKLHVEPSKRANTDVSTILYEYNYISIHQGILDKLYEAFNIKGDEQAKENLTRDFYMFFTKKHKIVNANKNGKDLINNYLAFKVDSNDKITHYFLPGMTIHSGRSKPAEHDMPQQLPFIPYSAIEHAVLDCKYSLVKLLNTARYE